jgi:hypothetical protein
MEATAVIFWESGFKIVFKEGIYSCEKFLGEYLYFSADGGYVNAVLLKLLPNDF